MKKILALLFALICFTGFAETTPKELRHIVTLKFKSDATAEQIKKVEGAFRELKNKIPEVVSLEWGTNISSEQRNKGFTHCFILSFASEKNLKTYADSAEHKAFVAILRPVMDDVFVFDFWSQH
ncbi:MAG: Dabb family protein [Verrucomicrobiales bacterium]|nr:Dabb family protein [Verrucomicrobiales bacterium]